MWKDSLRIGVDLVDEQHRELFRITEELLKELRGSGEQRKQKCISTVHFLKDYAVKHFADEEAYQKSIGYKGFDAHKKLHDRFRETVLHHESNMAESDYADKDIKAFIGMLIAWLLYHIADADQKYVKEAGPTEAPRGHSNIVRSSVCDTLCKMAGADYQSVKIAETHAETFGDSVAIEVLLTGDTSGYITLVYPLAFIRNFIYSMMNYTPEIIDELEMSAMFETSNIISGSICGQIAREKGLLCDIMTPHTTQRPEIQPEERITLDTGKGILEVDMSIAYK